MADQDIAQQWKSFTPERRQALLGKMSPEQKKKLRTTLEGGATASVAPDNTPGFFKRLAQGVGLPTSGEELKGMVPSREEIRQGLTNPMSPTALPVDILARRYLRGVGKEGGEAIRETKEAAQNVSAGQPILPNVGKVAAAGTKFLLSGLLSPVGGGAVQAWGEDIHSGNVTGAAGDATSVLVNALLLKGSSKPTAGTRANKIAFAADIPDTAMKDVSAQVKSVLPDLDAAATKPPATVGEMLENVKAAKEQLNSQVGQAMIPIRGKQIVPVDIANAIKSHITPDMAQTAQGRSMANALNKAAVEFQRPWTYEQLHTGRINANARMRAFFKKAGSAQYADMRNDVAQIVDREMARGVQDIVYPEMDRAAGKPQGYFRNLLTRQGTLITLGDALDENAKALATRTAKIKGSPRFSSENVSAYGHPATSPGISVHKLQNIVTRPNPLARASKAIARSSGSFRGSPVSHSMIYTLPVRELLLQQDEQEPPKTPADAKSRMREFAPASH